MAGCKRVSTTLTATYPLSTCESTLDDLEFMLTLVMEACRLRRSTDGGGIKTAGCLQQRDAALDRISMLLSG